jgi:hypothetical protein
MRVAQETLGAELGGRRHGRSSAPVKVATWLLILVRSLPSPGIAPALLCYFPDPAGTGVRIGEIRVGGAEVSGA